MIRNELRFPFPQVIEILLVNAEFDDRLYEVIFLQKTSHIPNLF